MICLINCFCINRINSMIGIGVGAGAYILTKLAVSNLSTHSCYNDQSDMIVVIFDK